MKKYVVLLLTAVLILAIILPSPVLAKGPDKDSGVKDALIQGADHMLTLQATYSGYENSWEWIIGSGNSYENVQGISALGMVYAWEATKNNAYLKAAIASGNTMVARYQAMVADGATWDDRPYSTDIEFLCQLGRDTHNFVYLKTAVDWYKIITDNKSPVQLVDRYISITQGNRASLAGWDLASQIRAAMDVGNWVYAKAIATELIRRSGDWEHVPLGGVDYTILSYGSLLWAFDQVKGFDKVIPGYTQAILAAQGSDGSWDAGTFQTTAYEILGLETVNGKNVQNAIKSAGTFLVSGQADNGGWVEPDGNEYGEDNSECLMALSSMITTGNQFGIFKDFRNFSHSHQGFSRNFHSMR